MARPDGSEPAASTSRWSDERVELLLGRLLRAGVVAAAILVLAGGVLYLRRHGLEPPDGAVFRGEPDDLTRVGGILRASGALSGRGLIMGGLLLLIATPVARVAVSLAAFVHQRDRLYVAITAFVLLLLLASLAGVAL
jgi:uncharacterized membrane protein